MAVLSAAYISRVHFLHIELFMGRKDEQRIFFFSHPADDCCCSLDHSAHWVVWFQISSSSSIALVLYIHNTDMVAILDGGRKYLESGGGVRRLGYRLHPI